MNIQNLLQIIINALIISICWAMGMSIMSINVLGRKNIVLTCAIYSGIFSVIQLFMNFMLLTILPYNIFLWDIGLFSFQAAILVVLLYRTYRERLVKICSVVALCHFALSTFYNVFEGIIFAVIPNEEQMGFYQYVLIMNILPHFVLFCFALFMAFLLKKMNFHIYFSHLFGSRGKSVVTLILCLLLMNSYVLVPMIFSLPVKSVNYAAVAFIMIFIALFFLQFVAMFAAGREQIRIQEETIIQQQAYVKLLEELQVEVRAFRHDFQNLLSGAALQAKEGDIDGIRVFLQDTTGYFDQKLGDEIKQMSRISQVKIYALRSLLTIKLSVMRQTGVLAELEVLLPVTHIGMRPEDMIRCLGILTDNAIEAAAQYNKGIVRILLLQEANELRVAISNTCLEKPNLQEMQMPHYTSKGIGRGTGLISYRRILADYPNCVTRTFWESGILTQELRIALE